MRWRRLVPDAIAADGDNVWVADMSRPCLLHIRRGHLVGVRWWGDPEGFGAASRLHADETGVWVVAEDGVLHCNHTGVISNASTEPVGATALGHSMLAAALTHAWPTRLEPDQVRLLAPTGTVAEIEVPGEICALVPTGDGYLGYLLDHGLIPTTALMERTARLVSFDAAGDLRVGPPLPHRSEWLSPLVGGSHPGVLVSVDGRWPPRLTSVLGDLSPAAGGLPLTPMAMWGGSRSGGRVVVWTHVPDGTGSEGWWPLPGPPARSASGDLRHLLTVLDLAAAVPEATWVVDGFPGHVAWANPARVWVSLLRAEDWRHVVMSWDLTGSEGTAELDLLGLVGSKVAMPVPQPLPEPDLAHHAEEQRRFIEEEARSMRRFETVDVTVRGTWPESHVIVRFRTLPSPGVEGAAAWPLFDGDGRPVEYDWEDHVAFDIEEKLDGLAVGGSRPGGGPVWVRPVRTSVEGLLPEV